MPKLPKVLTAICYGWWDCREAARDWWHYLRQDIAPDEIEEFAAHVMGPLFDTLGAPSDLPSYLTPWGASAEAEEYFQMLKTVLKGVGS